MSGQVKVSGVIDLTRIVKSQLADIRKAIGTGEFVHLVLEELEKDYHEARVTLGPIRRRSDGKRKH